MVKSRDAGTARHRLHRHSIERERTTPRCALLDPRRRTRPLLSRGGLDGGHDRAHGPTEVVESLAKNLGATLRGLSESASCHPRRHSSTIAVARSMHPGAAFTPTRGLVRTRSSQPQHSSARAGNWRKPSEDQGLLDVRCGLPAGTCRCTALVDDQETTASIVFFSALGWDGRFGAFLRASIISAPSSWSCLRPSASRTLGNHSCSSSSMW